MRLALLATAAIVVLAGPAASQSARGPFTVAETGRAYGTLQEAVGAIGGGTGTIRIAPGRYQDCAVQDAGRVTFVAERAGTAIFDHAICEGKATLVLRGRASKVDGIVFTHVEVGDGNGSGIRIEKGDLNVTNAMFVDNQGGILSATDPTGNITVDRSTFSGLGKDPTGNGAHSIYIGEYGSLTVTRCRFERGRGGHYLKSRSPRITVLDSSFDDTHGHITNYMIDLSNGATGRIAGNEFVVGTDKENHSTLITVAPEGVRNDSNGLVVEGNRARLAPGAAWHPDFVGNWSSDKVVVRNNQLGPNIRPLNSRWL